MIFIANKADFSAKNIGKVNYAYDNTEGDEGATTLITQIQIKPLASNNIKIGNRTILKTIVYPLNAYMRLDLEWESSNPENAFVKGNADGTCTLTVLNTGTFSITARAKDGSEVETTATYTGVNRTISDITDETEKILGYYTALENRTYTDAQKIALDTLVTRLGIQHEGSIWSKFKVLWLPCLGSSMANAAINVCNGTDHVTMLPTHREKMKFENGRICYNGTSATLSTQMVYGQRTFKISDGYSFIFGGLCNTGSNASNIWGRHSCSYATTLRVGLDSRSGYEYYSMLSTPSMRGGTTDWTLEGTHLAPSALITSLEDKGFDTIVSTIHSATYYADGAAITFATSNHYMYTYMLGQPLTALELETAIFCLKEFFTAMGVAMES